MKPTLAYFLMLHVTVSLGGWPGASADTVSWDVIGAGGEVGLSSGSYQVSASVGQIGVELLESPSYRIYSGFWNPWLGGQVGAEDRGDLNLPTTYQLSQNYPNPFDSQTTIHYAVPTTSHVTLEIYDLMGHQVRLLEDEAREPGYYFIRWDGKNGNGRKTGSGVYLCHMRARAGEGEGFSQSREMLLLH
jgi:hypothetical protein